MFHLPSAHGVFLFPIFFLNTRGTVYRSEIKLIVSNGRLTEHVIRLNQSKFQIHRPLKFNWNEILNSLSILEWTVIRLIKLARII
jgi:hypothetical protein